MPLSPAGRARVSAWTLPEEFRDFDWVSSPLSRATETAGLLGLEFTIEPTIIEMDWGAWEGCTNEELRARYGDVVAQREAQGLDLRPHEGETPRELQARITPWLVSVAAGGQPTGAVTHQGVIRAIYGLASGWNMTTRPPVRMEWGAVQLFTTVEGGTVEIARLNVTLEPS